MSEILAIERRAEELFGKIVVDEKVPIEKFVRYAVVCVCEVEKASEHATVWLSVEQEEADDWWDVGAVALTGATARVLPHGYGGTTLAAIFEARHTDYARIVVRAKGCELRSVRLAVLPLAAALKDVYYEKWRDGKFYPARAR